MIILQATEATAQVVADVAAALAADVDGYDAGCLSRDFGAGLLKPYQVLATPLDGGAAAAPLLLGYLAVRMEQCGQRLELVAMGLPRPERLRAARVNSRSIVAAALDLAARSGAAVLRVHALPGSSAARALRGAGMRPGFMEFRQDVRR